MTGFYLQVLGQDDALQARLEVLLEVKDGSALLHLHLGLSQLDFCDRAHLVQDLQLVPGVGHVVGPGVLLVLGSKHLFVGFPLGINLYIPQDKYYQKTEEKVT